MDETEYRHTYSSINPLKCCFEKAINSRRANCCRSTRFNLADREGVACNQSQACTRCNDLLGLIRTKCRFALKLTAELQDLPHNAEIRIQLGLIHALQTQFDAQSEENIDGLLQAATEKYQTVEQFPHDLIVRTIAQFKLRSRRGKREP